VAGPRITFGIIVLNGEPFTRYLLRELYPFAHQIVVVEGACPGAVATDEGHSTDGTLDVLARFKEEEDPDDKLVVVTRDGGWSEKTEQSQAFAERATGDYLWVCGVDEFYTPDMLVTVARRLSERPEIDVLSFGQITFWGGIDYIADTYFLHRGWWRDGAARVFRWGDGYRYLRHRPELIVDPRGRDLRDGVWLRRKQTERWGVRMLHYSLVFPRQVIDKCSYYQAASWVRQERALEWAEHNWRRLEHPFRVHNVYDSPSWLERYEGPQPPQIVAMMDDIQEGRVQVESREVDDIERLLSSPRYRTARGVVKALEPVDRLGSAAVRQTRRLAGAVSRRARRGLAGSRP
jgi:hypothetical protein